MKPINLILISTLIIVSFFGLYKLTATPINSSIQARNSSTIYPDEYFIGKPSAPIKVIEYSDYECPACKNYSNVGSQITHRFNSQVQFSYRHFPLKQIHPISTVAAAASMAAGNQGKFFEYSELLFKNQDDWANNSQAKKIFSQYASSLNLDVSKFSNDLISPSTKSKVESSYLNAMTLKLNSTPTFFINGQLQNNLKGVPDLLDRIDLVLKESTQSANTN